MRQHTKNQPRSKVLFCDNNDDVFNANMIVTYGRNSLYLYFTSLPLLYGSVGLGLFVIVHSFIIHRNKWKLVRIVSDIAAACLVLEAICFIIFMRTKSPTIVEEVALLDILGTSVFGAVVAAADNFMTFARFEAVSGKSTRFHRGIVLTYVVLINFLTWWEFYTICPIFWNMNDPKWFVVETYLTVWVNFIGYILFDAYYTGIVIYLLVKHIQNSKRTGEKCQRKLMFAAGNALGHTVLSMVGIFTFAYMFPLGIMVENMLIVIGIHFFLNCSMTRYASIIARITIRSFRSKTSSIKTAPMMTPIQVKVGDLAATADS